MAERAAEGVPGPEAVDDLDRERRHVGGGAVPVDGEDALRPLFDDGEFDSGGEQRAGRRVRFALTRGDLALVDVAHGDRRMGERFAVAGRGGGAAVAAVPEHGPPVEVEHGGGPGPGVGSALAAGAERGQRRGQARFGAQAGARHPEDPRRAHRLQVQVRRPDLQIGRLGLPVEVEREVVRREDLAERDRRRVLLDRRHPPVVHAEPAQLLVEVVPEGVLPGAGDHGRAPPEPGRRDGDVRRGAAQELAERVDPGQRHPDVPRVDVHPDPPHGDHVVRLRHTHPFDPPAAG
ncbi:hypothetical protein EES43_09320 [Streptomyces sp. ADI96-02]|nr:hypothetical protein EES43_09320 [Streptomyces sp. ADI96-02]